MKKESGQDPTFLKFTHKICKGLNSEHPKKDIGSFWLFSYPLENSQTGKMIHHGY
jgi:hypothetical protein